MRGSVLRAGALAAAALLACSSGQAAETAAPESGDKAAAQASAQAGAQPGAQAGAQAGVQAGASANVCQRGCLAALVDAYLDALVAHKPAQLALVPHVRYTENGVERRVGDALWQTASGRGRYRLIVADPESGQVGFYGTVLENGKPVLLALRLRIDARYRISEIESLVARGEGAPAGMRAPGEALEARGQPRPQFVRTVAASERLSRAQLIRIADSYFSNLQGSTGKSSAPFAASCERWENGTQTTHVRDGRSGSAGFDVLALGCEAQQRSGFFSFVTGIRNRRFPVVDRERGLVLSFAYFEHSGAVRELHLADGKIIASPVAAPLSLQISELFQIDEGKIDQIEAVINTVPYGMRSDLWDR